MRLFERFWLERQAKYISNSVRVYEFFGYDWWLLLWDKEFVVFWGGVPLELRKDREWYKAYVNNSYASVAGDAFLKNATGVSPFYVRNTKHLLRRANYNAYLWFYKVWKSKRYQTSPINPYWRYPSEFVSKRLMSGYTAIGIDAEQFIATSVYAEDPRTGLL